MSKILDLAKNFEQTSNEQAKHTEIAVSNEFKKHEQRLTALLNENEKAISNAIQEQNKRILPITLKIWSTVAIAIITVLLSMWGLMTYQSYKIKSNMEQIALQEQTIQRLSEKGGNMQFQNCIDKKNRKRLCVLVNKDAGTWENGSLMIPMGY